MRSGQEYSDPEAVLRDVFDALSNRDWDRVADRVHPRELKRFAAGEIQFVAMGMKTKRRTLAEMMEDLDGAPEHVAKWFLEKEAEHYDPEPRWTPAVFGAADMSELRALPARLVFIRWLSATYDGTVPWQAFGGPRCEFRREVLGSVIEERPGGRRLAHVIYRAFDAPTWVKGSKVEMTTLHYSHKRDWMIGTDATLLIPGRRTR